MKSLNLLQPFGLLALRLALGVIFFAHGYPKLAHLGGGMQEFFVQHGLPGYFVYVAGVLEVFGGLLLMLGLFTRPAAEPHWKTMQKPKAEIPLCCCGS